MVLLIFLMKIIFLRKILGITSSISYEGETFSALIEDFQCAVDDYLDIRNTELSPFKTRLHNENSKRIVD